MYSLPFEFELPESVPAPFKWKAGKDLNAAWHLQGWPPEGGVNRRLKRGFDIGGLQSGGAGGRARTIYKASSENSVAEVMDGRCVCFHLICFVLCYYV